MTIIPAYGRDYKSAKQARADSDNGLDFQCAVTRKYLSKRDNLPDVWIRYNKMTKIVKA
jgi:hypothetical protein